MLKRDDPFTPQPRQGKKLKDHASPLSKTPLRNMMSAENMAVEAARSEVRQEVHLEKQRSRAAALLSRRKDHRAQLLSPSSGKSPKAVPLPMDSPAAAKALLPTNARPVSSPHASSPRSNPKSVEQMNRSFEEWMRIAADNKINSKNTWNLALIDYFSELAFLRDGDSINFQKASCTLDGCVKIYSSRVDAVADETGKLLSGLSGAAGDGDIEQELSAEGEDEEEAAKERAKPRRRAQGETLEKNPEVLRLRASELGTSELDPLFRKTCGELDESAGGTLLFSLMVDRDCKVLFDMNTAIGQARAGDEPESFVDASSLVSVFGGELAGIHDCALTRALDGFSFLAAEDRAVSDRLAETLEKLSLARETLIDDPFQNTEPQNDGGCDGIADHIAFQLDDACHAEGDDVEGQFTDVPAAAFAPSDAPALGDFSAAMRTTWAGAEHWKIKRLPARATLQGAAAGKERKRQPAELAFTSSDIDLDTLLQKGASISLPEQSFADTCLPDDLHYSTDQLTRLFTKPTWRYSQMKTVVVQTKSERRERTEFAVVEHAEPAVEAADFGGLDDDDQQATAPEPDSADIAQPSGSSHMAFSRRAKRVDVHLLKETIWGDLKPSLARASPAALSGVLAGVSRAYQKRSAEERNDLSVPYAFICLLHLANENGLQLCGQDGDLAISQC